MTAQHKFILTWWLLPLFVVRGLVPAGFMLDTSHGGVSMVICSGGVYKTVAVDEQGSFGDGAHQSQPHGGDSVCPFAFAASAPVSNVLAIGVVAPPTIGAIDNHEQLIDAAFGPTRAQQSRGPPTFS